MLRRRGAPTVLSGPSAVVKYIPVVEWFVIKRFTFNFWLFFIFFFLKKFLGLPKKTPPPPPPPKYWSEKV